MQLYITHFNIVNWVYLKIIQKPKLIIIINAEKIINKNNNIFNLLIKKSKLKTFPDSLNSFKICLSEILKFIIFFLLLIKILLIFVKL